MILQGRDIRLLTADGTTVVAAAKSCSLTIDTDMEEVASATSADWREFRDGRSEWKVSIAHLVTTERYADVLRNGNKIFVQMKISVSDSLPFSGFVQDVTIEQSGVVVENPTIYFDTDNEFFVVYHNNKYYRSWLAANAIRYMNPSEEDVFVNNDENYHIVSGVLEHIPNFGGYAYFRRLGLTAGVKNLAQGQTELQGTGPLADYVPTT